MTLAAPLFLLGLLAMALPWLLHRLNRQDAQVQDFPSSRFLQATTVVSSRSKKLRYLKLLALRLLLIAMLCALFAEPAIRLLAARPAGAEKLQLIVLDKSFSMHKTGNWTRAREQFADILGALPAGSSMQLLSAAAALSQETQVTTERQLLQSALASVEPGYQRLRYGELMQQLSAHALKSELPVHLHIISDMQASAMPQRVNELHARGFAALQLYDVSGSDDSAGQSNRALRARVKARDQESFDLIAEVRLFAAPDVAPSAPAAIDPAHTRAAVSLFNAGELIASRSLPAGVADTAVLSFEGLPWPAGRALEHYELRLTPEDALPADDHDIVAVRRQLERPIAIVSNATRRQRQYSVEELYLKTALALDPRNRVTTHAADSLNLPADTRMVIYLDFLPLQDDALPALPQQFARLLDEGVHLLYVLSAAAPRLQTPGEVLAVAEKHPLKPDPGAWRDVRFYAQQSIRENPQQQVLIQAGAAYPVLLEQRRDETTGAGRVLWLNAALNGADNSLPVSPVFVPQLQALVDYCLQSGTYPRELTVGEGMRLEKSVQLLDPDGNPLLSLAEQGSGKTQLMSKPGIYTLLESSAEFPVRVVTDIAESDLRRADGPELEQWQAATTADVSASDNSLSAAQDSGAQNDTLYSLTRWLLPACLLLLLLESLYANWHLRSRGN